MKKFFSNLTLKQRLALIAGVLALGALIVGNPYNNNKAVIDLKELAIEVERAQDHVTVEELADWIIKGNSDFRLIDIRTEKEFNEYHIPTALNVPVTSLISQSYEKNEKIVIYSQGGIHSAQAWYLMRAKGYKKVYFIAGGLDDWKEKILFPVRPTGANAEAIAQFNKLKEVSKYFGGTPQDSASQNSKAAPKLSMPSVSGGGAAAPAGGAKKKKEGC
jgi:sulfur-carrier protein adenylyltransferase/sulfurtransferase